MQRFILPPSIQAEKKGAPVDPLKQMLAHLKAPSEESALDTCLAHLGKIDEAKLEENDKVALASHVLRVVYSSPKLINYKHQSTLNEILLKLLASHPHLQRLALAFIVFCTGDKNKYLEQYLGAFSKLTTAQHIEDMLEMFCDIVRYGFHSQAKAEQIPILLEHVIILLQKYKDPAKTTSYVENFILRFVNTGSSASQKIENIKILIKFLQDGHYFQLTIDLFSTLLIKNFPELESPDLEQSLLKLSRKKIPHEAKPSSEFISIFGNQWELLLLFVQGKNIKLTENSLLKLSTSIKNIYQNPEAKSLDAALELQIIESVRPLLNIKEEKPVNLKKFKKEMLDLYKSRIDSPKCNDENKLWIIQGIFEHLENNDKELYKGLMGRIIKKCFDDYNKRLHADPLFFLQKIFNHPKDDMLMNCYLEHISQRSSLSPSNIFKQLIVNREGSGDSLTQESIEKIKIYVDLMKKEPLDEKTNDNRLLRKAYLKCQTRPLIREAIALVDILFKSEKNLDPRLKLMGFLDQLAHYTWIEAQNTEEEVKKFIETYQVDFSNKDIEATYGIEWVIGAVQNLNKNRNFYSVSLLYLNLLKKNLTLTPQLAIQLEFEIHKSLVELYKQNAQEKMKEQISTCISNITKHIDEIQEIPTKQISFYTDILNSIPQSNQEEFSEIYITLFNKMSITGKEEILNFLMQRQDFSSLKKIFENLNFIKSDNSPDDEIVTLVAQESDYWLSICTPLPEKPDNSERIWTPQTYLNYIISMLRDMIALSLVRNPEFNNELKPLLTHAHPLLQDHAGLSFLKDMPFNVRGHVFSFFAPISINLIKRYIETLPPEDSTELNFIAEKLIEIIRRNLKSRRYESKAAEEKIKSAYAKELQSEFGKQYPEKATRLFIYQATRARCKQLRTPEFKTPSGDDIKLCIQDAVEKSKSLGKSLEEVMSKVSTTIPMLSKDRFNLMTKLGNLISAWYPNFPFELLPNYLPESIIKFLQEAPSKPIGTKKEAVWREETTESKMIPSYRSYHRFLPHDKAKIRVKIWENTENPHEHFKYIEITDYHLLILLRNALPEKLSASDLLTVSASESKSKPAFKKQIIDHPTPDFDFTLDDDNDSVMKPATTKTR